METVYISCEDDHKPRKMIRMIYEPRDDKRRSVYKVAKQEVEEEKINNKDIVRFIKAQRLWRFGYLKQTR